MSSVDPATTSTLETPELARTRTCMVFVGWRDRLRGPRYLRRVGISQAIRLPDVTWMFAAGCAGKESDLPTEGAEAVMVDTLADYLMTLTSAVLTKNLTFFVSQPAAVRMRVMALRTIPAPILTGWGDLDV